MIGKYCIDSKIFSIMKLSWSWNTRDFDLGYLSAQEERIVSKKYNSEW